MNNYWTHIETDLIREFYYCYTASTSAITRNQIFNTLMPKFNHMIDIAQYMIMESWSKEDKEEARQDVLMRIWYILNNDIEISKIVTVLNFLWISIRNLLYTIARQSRNKKVDVVFDSENKAIDMYTTTVKDIDVTENQMLFNEIKKEIYGEIDSKILAEGYVNKRNTIYLIMLKEYLIENDCDSRGFREYICKKLKINRRNFYNINHKLNIRSAVFNNKK